MQLSHKIRQQKAPIILFFYVLALYIVLQGRATLFAQDFAYDDKGNIVWEAQGTGNPQPGYHYHTIGWKFTITQNLSKVTYKKTVTVYLGTSYSTSSTYAKSGGITSVKTGTYSSTYYMPVSKLSELTGLELERGTVAISVDAIIEFYKRTSSAKCTSAHISTSKSDANNYCKKYGFRSNFDGLYTGYYGQNVTQKYFALTVKKQTGVNKVTINGASLTFGQTMWYKKGTQITLKETVLAGYHTAGWSGDKQQTAATLKFNMPGEGLALRALAEAEVYPLALDGNGGTVQRPSQAMSNYILEKYNTAWGYYSSSGQEKYWTQAKPSTGFKAVREGYAFQGFFTKKTGGTKVIDSAGKITCSNTIFTDITPLYAQWKANTNTPYAVRHWQQDIGGNGYTLKETEQLKGTTGAKVTPGVKNYEGFTAPKAIAVTISGAGDTVVNYYYTRNIYRVALQRGSGIGNMSVSGSFNKEEYEDGYRYWYGERITAKAQPKTGYKTVTWSGGFSAQGTSYTFLMPAHDVTALASALPIQYRLFFNGNGADSGNMPYMLLSYGTGVRLSRNQFIRNGYEFAGWSRKADGKAEFSDGQEVLDLTDRDGDVILFYAVWKKNTDYSPVITAAERSFSIEQAQSGKITQEELFSTASVYDEEDGVILPGMREENFFVIVGFDPGVFTSLIRDSIIDITYQAQDTAGNRAERTVSIYVTDENGNSDPGGRSGFRFISGKYLDEAPTDGGLCAGSIWRTGEYYETLVKLLK